MSNKYKKERSEQLGMDVGKANHKLVKDILWNFAVKLDMNKCFQCGEEMTRETFSIEHKIPWLHSDNPSDLFFDIDNISFSHLKCNIGAARKNLSSCGKIGQYRKGCRCELCVEANRQRQKNWYNPERRRQRYLEKGT